MNSIRFKYPAFSRSTALDRLASLSDLLGAAIEDRGYQPLMNVYDDENDVTVEIEAPGLRKEDFSISLEKGTLVVKGQKKGDRKRGVHAERSFGAFERSLTVPYPINASGVKANYENGVLSVVLPKSDEVKPRKIELN
jgi:HSP20 family protein